MKNSIRRQMQVWLMIPLLILLVVSAVCSYVLSMYLSREAYDKALLNSIDSLGSRVNVDEAGKISIEKLSKRTLTLLTHENKDQFLFEVYAEDGKLLTDDFGLPKPPQALKPDEDAILKYVIVGNRVYRVAVTKAQVGEADSANTVLIQAGETLNARKEYRRKLLLGIVIPQMILLALAVLAVWISIEKGLKPLRTISEVVSRRAPSDLSPIHEENAPAEVKSFLKALNGLFVRISDDIDRQQRFAANAAHQLRTPLAGLKTYLQVMEKTTADPEFKGMITQMKDGVERIIRTVQQLLSLSRAEQGQSMMQGFNIIDLNTVAEEAATEVVPEALRRNIELDLNTPDAPTKIRGDSISLKELITNLLENAIKYNKPGGFVSLKIENGNNVSLTVEDNGIGVPESDRARVFERFYRVSSSSCMAEDGSGLGLSIVTEIARLHQATVSLEPGDNSVGSRFKVVFPEVREIDVQNSDAKPLPKTR